jgi:hypothetical protein
MRIFINKNGNKTNKNSFVYALYDSLLVKQFRAIIA